MRLCLYASLHLLFPHNLHNNPLAALSVEFCVINLLPGAKIEPPFCNGNNDFVSYKQAFEVAVAVCFACAVVVVVDVKWRKLFQPLVNVGNKPAFGVVDVDSGCNVHSGNQHHTFLNPALGDDFLHFVGNVNIFPMLLRIKPKIFRFEFHNQTPFVKGTGKRKEERDLSFYFLFSLF